MSDRYESNTSPSLPSSPAPTYRLLAPVPSSQPAEDTDVIHSPEPMDYGAYITYDLPVPRRVRESRRARALTDSAATPTASEINYLRLTALTYEPSVFESEDRSLDLRFQPMAYRRSRTLGDIRTGPAGGVLHLGPSSVSQDDHAEGKRKARPTSSETMASITSATSAHVDDDLRRRPPLRRLTLDEQEAPVNNTPIEIALYLPVAGQKLREFLRVLYAASRSIAYLSDGENRPPTSAFSFLPWRRPPPDSPANSRSTGHLPAASHWFFPSAWRKVVLIIVIDGESTVDGQILVFLETIGLYSPVGSETGTSPQLSHSVASSLGTSGSARRSIRVRCFESIVELPNDMDPTPATPTIKRPMKCILLTRQTASGKVKSLNHFFALCKPLQPRATVMLTAHMALEPSAMWHLWKAHYNRPNVGVAYGQVVSERLTVREKCLNPITQACHFDCKLKHALHKRWDSVLGHMMDVSATLACYRYESLLKRRRGSGPSRPSPLESCLFEVCEADQPEVGAGNVNIPLPPAESPQTANSLMLLHRQNTRLQEVMVSTHSHSTRWSVLSFELLSQGGVGTLGHYVPKAIATRSCPTARYPTEDEHENYVASLHNLVYTLANIPRLWKSNHTRLRIVLLQLQIILQCVDTTLTSLQPTHLYSVLHHIGHSLTLQSRQENSGSSMHLGVQVLRWLYLFISFHSLVLSIGKQTTIFLLRVWGWLIIGLFGAIILLASASAIYLLLRGVQEVLSEDVSLAKSLLLQCSISQILGLIIAHFCIKIFTLVLSGEFADLPLHIVQYLVALPTQVNVFQVGAYANAFMSNGDEVSVSDSTFSSSKTSSLSGLPPQGANANAQTLSTEEQIEESYKIALEQLRHLQSQQAETAGAATVTASSQPVSTARSASTRGRTGADVSTFLRQVRTTFLLLWLSANFALMVLLSYLQSEGETDLRTGLPVSKDHQAVCDTNASGRYLIAVLLIGLVQAAVKFAGAVVFKIQMVWRE